LPAARCARIMDAMLGRREVLGAFAAPAFAPFLGAAPLCFRSASASFEARLAALARHAAPAHVAAEDESFWFEVQQAFSADRSLINLNNGGVSPAPVSVQDALERHLDYANTAPVYAMWRVQEPQKESVRRELARLFGCDAEEIAITRNASEGLQTCQLGLDLEPGDEVLTTNQDYPRMLTTFEQRVRRDGIVLRKISIPTPCEDPARIVRLFEESLTERTRLVLVCHVVNLTGQILPVRDVERRGRARAAYRSWWTARTPSRTSRSSKGTSSATTSRRACTSGSSRRSAPACSTCGAKRSPGSGR
jgi:hypothetical protein